MTFEEAVTALKSAGLYVRSQPSCILGGSHIDASGEIRIIHNGFGIFAEDGLYLVRTHLDAQGPGVGELTLEEAVKSVLEKIHPQPSIEAVPQPAPKGTVYY